MDRIAIARRALNNTSSSRHSFLRRSHVVCCNRNASILSTRLCAHPSNIRQFSSLPTPSNSSSLQSKEESNNEVATADPYAHLIPIDYTTSSVISGEESQECPQIQLKPNQMVRAESGAMLYMTDGVHMETSMGLGGSSGSGLSAGLTRMMTGQNLMVSDFTYTKQDGSGTIALGTDFPAKILRFNLDEYPNAKLVCQKGAYLAGSHSVAMEMAYTKNFSSGFFGGEGFILQSLQATNVDGSGSDETVFLKAYGTVVKKDLKDGETLRVSSGSLVCMTSDVDYDVTMMPGFKNVMFGGEGLFVTTLTGPGSVWLQGMPVDRMVSEIARHIPSGGGIGLGIPIGMGGGGGGEGAAGDMAAGEAAGELAAEGGEDSAGVPLTEDAVDADRNATVASSGGVESSSDPESSESLFGDAAYGGGSAPEQTDTTSSSSTNEDSFSSTADDFSNKDDSMNMFEFEEPTTTEDQFEDDGTTFSTYDEGSESTAGDTEGVDMPNDEEGPGLLGQLWDMFRDFTDDD